MVSWVMRWQKGKSIACAGRKAIGGMTVDAKAWVGRGSAPVMAAFGRRQSGGWLPPSRLVK
jgi:hypothetical protein